MELVMHINLFFYLQFKTFQPEVKDRESNGGLWDKILKF